MSVLMIVLVLASIPSVLQIVSGGAYYSTNELPVNQSAAFDPPQTANLSQSQSPEDARFTVTVENQTQYTVSRQDAVGNPSHVLRPTDAQVVGTTLVIREESVITDSDPDPDTLSPSVVSTGSYTEQWTITVPIDRVAVYHPYQDHPYVKSVNSN
ncbi:hypothetical protein [Haloquadratum walsbyi]|uniref:hypothetical protein n=1 Tax=Haloquadratum walsbyi TaxID=293091 RepID=UPI0026F162C8|nr:hypothetical protein [Haloquadratum walsbyi]